MKTLYKNCNSISQDKNCNIIINDNDYDDNYVQIFIMRYNEYNNENLCQTLIKDQSDKIIFFKYSGDGFYTICRLTIPRDENMPYYYKDGEFYHNQETITLLDLVEVNPIITRKKYIYYFSTCNLKKCFIDICKNIFEQKTSFCNKSNVDNSMLYKKDLLLSALNVIDYLVELDQMEEASRLLKRITECNGLCSEQTNINCGCKK